MCRNPYRPGGPLAMPLPPHKIRRPIFMYKRNRYMTLAEKKLVGTDLDCGKCPYCRRKRSNEWALRIMHEMAETGKGCFVTLTYRNADLPEGGSLDKKHLQDYIKRLRRRIDNSFAIKYYECGEYGTTTYRAHYHLALLGVDASDFLRICDATPLSSGQSGPTRYHETIWKKGHVVVGGLTLKSAQYVAWYTQHKQSNFDYEKAGKEPPFQLQSTGIGKEWALRNEAICRTGVIRSEKVNRPVPRYYCKVLEIDRKELYAEHIKTSAEDLICAARLDGVPVTPPPPSPEGPEYINALALHALDESSPSPPPVCPPSPMLEMAYYSGFYVTMAFMIWLFRYREQYNIDLLAKYANGRRLL